MKLTNQHKNRSGGKTAIGNSDYRNRYQRPGGPVTVLTPDRTGSLVVKEVLTRIPNPVRTEC
jgi:hypothetical protein